MINSSVHNIVTSPRSIFRPSVKLRLSMVKSNHFVQNANGRLSGIYAIDKNHAFTGIPAFTFDLVLSNPRVEQSIIYKLKLETIVKNGHIKKPNHHATVACFSERKRNCTSAIRTCYFARQKIYCSPAVPAS